MKIEILGPGCWRCNAVYGNVRKAVTELKIRPEIVHIRDLSKIADYGVMTTPGLVIDGKVMSSGRIPTVEEILGWLKK